MILTNARGFAPYSLLLSLLLSTACTEEKNATDVGPIEAGPVPDGSLPIEAAADAGLEAATDTGLEAAADAGWVCPPIGGAFTIGCPATPDKLDLPYLCQNYLSVRVGGCDAYEVIGLGRVDTSNECIYERATGKYVGQTFWVNSGPRCALEPDASVSIDGKGMPICSGGVDDSYPCTEDGGFGGGIKVWDAALDAAGDGSGGYDGSTIDN